MSHKLDRVRTACAMILKKLVPGLLEKDSELLNKRNEHDTAVDNKNGNSSNSHTNGESWHLMHKFNRLLAEHAEWAHPYIEEFK